MDARTDDIKVGSEKLLRPAIASGRLVVCNEKMRICSRCHRANPDEAVFCYFDGICLETATGLPHDPHQGQAAVDTKVGPAQIQRVDSARLPWQGNHLDHQLTPTNGVMLEVPVQAGLLADRLFHGYPVQKVEDLAKLLIAHSHEAIGWLSDGSIERWFAGKGLPFPIQGPIAPGKAGLQQLFETLSVSKPPHLKLDDKIISILCRRPERVSRCVRLETADKKWVYAFVQSEVHWLQPTAEVLTGPQRVDCEFVVVTALLVPDRIHEGIIHLTANGREKFSILVRADVRRSNEPFTRRILKPFLPR